VTQTATTTINIDADAAQTTLDRLDARMRAVASGASAQLTPALTATSGAAAKAAGALGPLSSVLGGLGSTGAQASGDGTGAQGPGDGTGSGNGGQGRGGGIASGPTVQSGSIDSARDFPIPEGGRRVREGSSVTVVFTVGVDGRASNCSVSRGGPDPATNALVCPLVVERIRFNPARDANGNPVAARYGWRQDFFRRP
jgi:protein TonB